ncbi:hypothetical protein TNCV_2352131 [Trichonephila clavipes]|nr:hypothetical protein TNCV_2352131 [Trichonephila clavipes]
MTESNDSSSLSSEHTLPYGSKDSSDCSICFSSDDSEQYTLSQCKHTFHSRYLKQWVESGKHACPYCRGGEPEEIMSDTESESDLYYDSDSESESIPVLEFIPNTVNQLIEDIKTIDIKTIESRHKNCIKKRKGYNTAIGLPDRVIRSRVAMVAKLIAHIWRHIATFGAKN